MRSFLAGHFICRWPEPKRPHLHPDFDQRRFAASSAAGQGSVVLPCGLIYVSDALLPGISRFREGDGFVYRQPDGSLLDDEGELRRISRLAIPPAYTDVWICPLPNGHLQATGRDARGRKQYRYHEEWNALRKDDKFARLEAFGRALPRIRRRVARDLAGDDGRTVTRTLVLATLIRLLDTTFVRVGNDSYARQNHSYGLTTLRNRHADVRGSTLRLSFRGKRGIHHDVRLDDRRIVRVVRRCKQLPGQELFQYEEDGEIHRIDSGDVNDYLAEVAGERFTAKDFRTWHGTVEALELTRLACVARQDQREAFSAQKVLSAVAQRLGNTVAVCRKAYVHPAVLALGQRLAKDSAAMATLWAKLSEEPGATGGLPAAERRLMRFLAQHRRSQKRIENRSPKQTKASAARPAAAPPSKRPAGAQAGGSSTRDKTPSK